MAGTSVTVLHVSDLQIGSAHVFGGNGLTSAAQAREILHGRLHDDLAAVAREHGVRPDLIVVTGDLAESGMRPELRQALEVIGALADAVELPRHRVAVLPGNHDVNHKMCQAYFDAREADELEPVPPYYPKWTQYVDAVRTFYEGVAEFSFSPEEPYGVLELPDLGVAVACLNSTMAESHCVHHGWVGEDQLRRIATRLAGYRSRGWLRLAAVHHNVARGAMVDGENLRDADDLDRILGQPHLVHLLLHGHSHDGRLHRLSSGLIALGTGSAAVIAEARPAEVPNQYQLITIDRDGFTRFARQYAPSQRRWVGDTRVSPNGSSWQDRTPHPLADVDTALPPPPPTASPARAATIHSGQDRPGRAEIRVGFGVDAVGYSCRAVAEKALVQSRLAILLADVLVELGVDPAEAEPQPGGDSTLVFLPARVEPAWALPRLMSGWRSRLAQDNGAHPDRLRLRVAAVVGPVAEAALGWSHNTAVEAGRLLDSDILRQAINDHPGTDLAMLISDTLYKFTVAEGHPDLERNQFAAQVVTVKDYHSTAWLWVAPHST